MAEVLERSLYEEDYYAWTKDQAAKLRAMVAARVGSPLDLENLAEEVESLGRSDFATVCSQMRRIVEHMLKLEHSPAADPRFGSRSSVIEARDVIADVITASLRREVEAVLDRTYEQGRRNADAVLRQHGERDAAGVLPKACPYTFDQIVGHDWFPVSRHGRVDDIEDG